VEKNCQACTLNKENAMDRRRRGSRQRMVNDQDGCEWVNVSSGTGSPG